MTQIRKIQSKGWSNCYHLANRQVDLIVTSDVGPRILRFGFAGEHNELKEFPEQAGLTGGDTWRIYGGHRLWCAPEVPARTYQPDNFPVEVEVLGGTLRLTPPVEAAAGIQKQMEITLEGSRVRVLHRLTNAGLWTEELGAWALTVMDGGGTCILPLPPRAAHDENLLPTNTLTMWAYTDLSDPRWTLGRRFLLLRQDATHPEEQKIGLLAPDGWIAYANRGHLLIKRVPFQAGAAYPDMGSSLETYANGSMLEIETLSPLTRLEPGASVEHLETWSLHKDIPAIRGDADVEKYVLNLV
jgi:hypothetical protein